MQASRVRVAAGLIFGIIFLGGCASEAPPPPAAGPPAVDVDALPADRDWLVDAAASTGLDFVHVSGAAGEFYFPEIMGPGGALFDYDGDGDLDVYLVQGGVLGDEATEEHVDRLFRNDLTVDEDGTLRLTFTDVTDSIGVRSTGYGMGTATGDYDGDGDVDLYVTNFGQNRLLRNEGDGTFSDVTEAAGAGDPRWSTSAAFVDFDRDGRLDLYVCNYVDYRLVNHKPCFISTGAQDYCQPGAYAPVPDRLLRNRGDGTFEDVSLASRIAVRSGNGLGVVIADLDGDGWPDISVANDQMPNHLWINRQDGTFEESALLAGVAINATGNPEASMGIDAGDFDGDGDDDLFMTHLRSETNTLYANDGSGRFTDRTVEAGLGGPSMPHTGFGTAWFDLNNDGWLDLFTANGAVIAEESPSESDRLSPYREENQLFLNLGDGRFVDVSRRAGAALERVEVSRGAAFGDVDNDGDLDILVTNVGGPARLLLNQAGDLGNWIGLRLVAGDSGGDVLGARVEVAVDGGRVLWRRARSDASYCSANDPRVLIGLADAGAVERVRVHWPDGSIESWPSPTINQWTTLTAGTGQGR